MKSTEDALLVFRWKLRRRWPVSPSFPQAVALFVLCLLHGLPESSRAQLCEGSLGDPVVKLDFGSGNSTHGVALGSDITSYTWTNADFPSDGYYTVESRTNTPTTWWTTTDHTGGGYMMVVNASFSITDYFYKNTVRDLCPGTTYEFAAWIMNLLRYSDNSTPNITFTIETPGGIILRTYSTGDIPLQSSARWKQYGFFFTTPENITEVVIRMRNNKAGAAPGNDIALDDITFRPCGPEISAYIRSSGEITQVICEGDTTGYTLSGEIESPFENAAYQWQISDDGGTTFTDIPGAVQLTYVCHHSEPGTYLYRLLTATSENIASSSCRTGSNAVTLTVEQTPLPDISSDHPACTGDDLHLTAAAGASSYFWTGPANFSSSLAAPVLANLTAINNGFYRLTLISDAGCTGKDSVYIEVNERPVAYAGEDTDICEGTAAFLNGTGGETYLWTPGVSLNDSTISTPVAKPADSTLFALTVSNGRCSDTDSVYVNVWKAPASDAGADQKIYEGTTVQLNGKSSGTDVMYYWTPGNLVSDPNILKPEASPTEDISFTLHVVSAHGCGKATDEVFIRVYKKVSIPNAFSPNGDGINDAWEIENLDTYPEADLIVFNRYGQTVFSSNGYTAAWDGKTSGTTLPSGTYFYEIDLKTGLGNPSGWVVILR